MSWPGECLQEINVIRGDCGNNANFVKSNTCSFDLRQQVIINFADFFNEAGHDSNSSKICNKNTKCVATDLLTEIARN
jgi:hypothetical protein